MGLRDCGGRRREKGSTLTLVNPAWLHSTAHPSIWNVYLALSGSVVPLGFKEWEKRSLSKWRWSESQIWKTFPGRNSVSPPSPFLRIRGVSCIVIGKAKPKPTGMRCNHMTFSPSGRIAGFSIRFLSLGRSAASGLLEDFRKLLWRTFSWPDILVLSVCTCVCVCVCVCERERERERASARAHIQSVRICRNLGGMLSEDRIEDEIYSFNSFTLESTY